MDGDTLELILARIDENHQDWKDVKVSIEKIQASIVGQAHCDDYRRDINAKLTEHTEQIRELKTVCDGYQATKTILISETELRDAKDDAIKQAGGKYDQLEERVKKLEHYVEVFGFAWSNPVARTFIVGSFLTLVGVYWGRIGQYGWHLVGAFLGAVAIVLLMSWFSRRKNREVTKTKTKQLFGLKFLILILLVLPCSAQDPPPPIDEIGQPRPIILQPDKVEKATVNLATWLEELLGMSDHERFMDTDYWPTNLSNISNSTPIYA
jgi:hypothetical protein